MKLSSGWGSRAELGRGSYSRAAGPEHGRARSLPHGVRPKSDVRGRRSLVTLWNAGRSVPARSAFFDLNRNTVGRTVYRFGVASRRARGGSGSSRAWWWASSLRATSFAGSASSFVARAITFVAKVVGASRRPLSVASRQGQFVGAVRFVGSCPVLFLHRPNGGGEAVGRVRPPCRTWTWFVTLGNWA